MKITLKELERFKKVTINYFSDYETEKSHDGGRYGFWTNFNRVGKNWEVTYGTTADFDFCPYCGNWGDSCGCNEPQIVSSLELLIELSSFRETEDEFIELAETA